MNQLAFKRLGIIADSHGNSEMVARAIAFLNERRCDRIIHLGDICDSFRPKTCEACVQLLKKHGIAAVKGNNDHILEINQTGNANTPVSEDSLSFLRHLPPVMTAGDSIFAHSLPFYSELGISCITKVMGKNEVKKFISENGHLILFRGHSHSPTLKYETAGEIISMDLPAGKQVDLRPHFPCVVTCGALTRGLVMIWDATSKMLSSLSIGN
jgi:predicted phosphodiesterase